MPEDGTDMVMDNEIPFNPLRVMKFSSKGGKKSKVGNAKSSRVAEDSDKNDNDKDPAPPSQSLLFITSNHLEEDLAAV